MHPPVRSQLQVLAGWCLSRCTGQSADAPYIALREACEAVIPLVEEAAPEPLKIPKAFQERPRSVKRPVVKEPDEEGQRYVDYYRSVRAMEGRCIHKFDFRTKRCCYCDQSFDQATKL